jgi:hypothetical protein
MNLVEIKKIMIIFTKQLIMKILENGKKNNNNKTIRYDRSIKVLSSVPSQQLRTIKISKKTQKNI